jgi:hypothetical protein
MVEVLATRERERENEMKKELACRIYTVPVKYFSLPNRLFFMLASVKKSLFFTLELLFLTLELLFFTRD